MFVTLKRMAALALTVILLASWVPRAEAAAPDVLRATLDNGLRVVIVRNTLAPVATEVVNYLVGAQDTPPGFPGMAHAEEHMVWARSTRDVSASQIASISTLLGGDSDADTQTTITQYYITAPSNYLDVSLHLEAARMRGALDLQSEWSQERGAIEQEVATDLSGAFYRYYEKSLATMFAGTPYAHDALGTRASFDKTTGPMLKHFYDTWYAPNNAVLVIAGDVDPVATLALVKRTFGDIPRRAVPAHPAIKLGAIPTSTTISDQSDYPVPFVILTYRLPGYRDPDYAATELAIDVLQSQRGALADLTYSGKALAAGAVYQPSPRAGVGFSYLAIPPAGDTSAALTLLDTTVTSYIKDGVPAELVEAQRKREIAQLLYSRNSIEGLAMDWSTAIAVQGLNSPDDAVGLFEKVSVANVNRVLRTYFVRSRSIAGVLTPKAGAVPSGGPIAVKDSFSASDAKPVPLPSWAAGLQTASVPNLKSNPADTILPNGIRLIVQPLSISPTVTVRGEVRTNGYLQIPPGKEGVDALLAGLFVFGTTDYDRLAYQAQLDQIAADVSLGSSFSLSVPSQGFDRGMELLADGMLRPALPDAGFKIVQTQTTQALQGSLTSPAYLAQRAMLERLLPKGDPALREATPATLEALAPGDVRTYYGSVFRPDMTTIVIAGDVTVEQAKAAVAKWFGAWNAAGPKPDTDLPPVPLNAGSTASVTAPGRVQSTVTLREEIGVTRSDPDYYKLQLGNAVLGGSFYSTRFYRDLRRNSGLVYNVSSSARADKTRGNYAVQYAADPKNVAHARVIVDQELRDMATRNVTPEELQSAKTQILRELALSEGSVDDITGTYVALATADLPLDQPTQRARAIVSLSADDVRAAFAKWIDPARFVQVTTGP